MKVTVLGCGSSQGVPMIGGRWGACDPGNPRNRRRRPSIFVEWEGVNILIDTAPEFRDQALDAGIAQVDAVLFTHAHADHVHGIDDLRGISREMGRDIDVHAESAVLDEIRSRFPYLFHDATGPRRNYPPFLRASAFDGPFEVHGRPILPFDQDHGICPSTGFRLGDFAYSTDVVRLPEASLDLLAGSTPGSSTACGSTMRTRRTRTGRSPGPGSTVSRRAARSDAHEPSGGLRGDSGGDAGGCGARL